MRVEEGVFVTVVFNPPPGWPIPPVGWVPDRDWRPDPTWPEAPDGWHFMIDASTSQITGAAEVLPICASPAGRTAHTAPSEWPADVPPGLIQLPASAQKVVIHPTSRGLTALAIGSCLIGLIINLQPASLLTGDTVTVAGAAIAGGGVLLAFVVSRRVWIKIVTVVLLLACILNVVYVEHALSLKRHQNEQIFRR